MQSLDVRSGLVEALRLDLVGPDNDHAFANELLPESPTRWYLTGFLVPRHAPEEQRTDPQAADEIDSGEDAEADDGAPPDRVAAVKSYLPSSLGLSVLVDPDAERLEAEVVWGEYVYEGAEDEPPPEQEFPAEGEEHATEARGGAATPPQSPRGYRRAPCSRTLAILLPRVGAEPVEVPVPQSRGLILVVTCRSVPAATGLPVGTRSVSVFLVNERQPNPDHGYRAFAFQAGLVLKSQLPFVARPDLRGLGNGELTEEWDARVGDLQYRDVHEYAVGHGVAAQAILAEADRCFEARTDWLPSAEVERVEPAPTPQVELGMEALADLANVTDAHAKLGPLVSQYRDWITVQRQKCQGLNQKRSITATELLKAAEQASDRIEAGIALLADPEILTAFRLANRTMAAAARRREAQSAGTQPATVAAPRWRPFQLAYILLTLRGMADPLHAEREVVDLLFFPTGGGKTEAYLGLAAFILLLRRLRNPGLRGAGVSVLMRYTLRLLTLDQMGRAATLICALELEREADARLGPWPFEIGLWVGKAATPNRIGHKGYDGPGKDDTAYIKTQRYKRDHRRYPRPIPLENCPWCGAELGPDSFRLAPNPNKPVNLEVRCLNHECDFSSARALPIIAVDEPIYRRLPGLLIATVDKFASLPWTGETGALFGRIERFDKDGFYGPCSTLGQSFGGRLPPPDLIIQDELHLISGPLGTIAGLYETAIDALSSWTIADQTVRPKIIASTATVRRADRQIRALFGRPAVEVFPPPCPDRRDSFFAVTKPSTEVPARLYVGVAAQGRSLKVMLLRSALALLSAGQRLWDASGGKKASPNPADPYMTLLGYFNSLRELGGSRRIVEDEVRARLSQYGRRRRLEPEDGLFVHRNIAYDVLELTSRVSTAEVAATKRQLSLGFQEKERVDVALATNMISVGLDIIRLGLMVVLGQPKTSAEYIQATSRVGRDPTRPGLVVTLLNIHKSRDRSHYERFGGYHATFYRAVEATSVTPFSPRALDRALVGALVSLARQGLAAMTPPDGAEQIQAHRHALQAVADCFAERALTHDGHKDPAEAQRLHDQVLSTCEGLLDDWGEIANQMQATHTRLQYQQWEPPGAQRLLYDMLDPGLLALPSIQQRFRANRSMRDVEPSVELDIRQLDEWRERS
nr:DISARM system helicase DrmA [Thiocapsa roseopersicina]